MKQFKIGLVYTPSPLTNIPRWYSLLSSVGDVSLILPHERNMRYDCVIIPDAGVNTNINAFKNRNYIAIGSEPICPMIEMFRIESLDYYIENDVPVIGVGQSRCLIANKLGQMKCILVQGLPEIPYNHSTHEITILKKEDFIQDFECGNLYGISHISSQHLFPILKDIKNKTINGEMDSLQTADVVNPPTNPLLEIEEKDGW
jgi:hypothetical protein